MHVDEFLLENGGSSSFFQIECIEQIPEMLFVTLMLVTNDV
jgi:hypothetical protein